MGRSSAVVVALLAAGCTPAANPGVNQSIATRSRPDVRRELAVLALPQLPDSASLSRVSYSIGYERRARRVRALVAQMRDYYARELGTNVDVQVAVLDTAAWTRISALGPYPIPFVTDSPSVAVVPATLVGTFADATGAPVMPSFMLPPPVMREMAQLAVSPADLPDVGRDVIILHELGHSYTIRYGIRPPTRWMSELLATYWQQNALASAFPALFQLGESLAEPPANARPAGTGYQPVYTSLADLERLNGPPAMSSQNYEWYQSVLGRRAAAVRRRYGLAFLRSARTAFPRAATATLSDSTVLARLQDVAPMVPSWQVWAASLGRE